MKLNYFLYPTTMIAMLIADGFVSQYADWQVGTLQSSLETLFGPNSVYSNNFFVAAILRTIISCCVILTAILALALTGNLRRASDYFKVPWFPTLIMISLFFHMNSKSENGNNYTYAVLVFSSFIFFVAREHFIFFLQEAFSTRKRSIEIGAVLALIAFIIFHPLTLSEGRVLGTLLMVNLWVYTISKRNIWLGVSLHMAWNFAYPESAIFHYALFLWSCFLAFGLHSYQDQLKGYFCWVPRKFSEPWRAFWSMPRLAYEHLRARLTIHG
jgi:hypothetical protein